MECLKKREKNYDELILIDLESIVFRKRRFIESKSTLFHLLNSQSTLINVVI